MPVVEDHSAKVPARAPRGAAFRAWTAAFVFLVLFSAGCAAMSRMRGRSDLYREDAADAVKRGYARFLYDDLGSVDTHALETVAIPYKFFITALVLSEAPKLGLPVERASLRPVLTQFGFLYPDSIGNAGAGELLRAEEPIGILRGHARGAIPGLGLEIGNNSCALCHSGNGFDADGLPTRTAWLGLPNGSLDLEAYSRAIYAGLRMAVADEDACWKAMLRFFPETSRGERFTYRHFILPRLRRELKAVVAARDRPLVFPAGAPGITNGVAALKLRLGLISNRDYVPHEVAFTSIPDLSHRNWRSSVLCDGTYTPAGATRFRPVTEEEATDARADSLAHIIAFFTLGTAGNDPKVAERAIPRAAEILRAIGRYEPPRFPGPRDAALLLDGRAVFEQRCSGCHGTYDEGLDRPRLLVYPNRLIPSTRIDTDSVRWAAVSDPVLRWREEHPRHPFVRHVDAARTGGYVPPILSGVWATAPYLHNGSVPTLWHLMHPEQRPERFQVGGHRLDWVRMGIAIEPGADGVWRYPAGYAPWSRPAFLDTSQPGFGRGGHTTPFTEMSESEKAAVLEYLKVL